MTALIQFLMKTLPQQAVLEAIAYFLRALLLSGLKPATLEWLRGVLLGLVELSFPAATAASPIQQEGLVHLKAGVMALRDGIAPSAIVASLKPPAE